MRKLSFATDFLKTASILEGTQEVRIWVTSLQGMTAALAEHLRAANDHPPMSVSTIMMFHLDDLNVATDVDMTTDRQQPG